MADAATGRDLKARMEALVALAQDRSPENRERLAHAMADLVLGGPLESAELGASERELVVEILRELARKVAPATRAMLADRLAGATHAPPRLVRDLAFDDIAVARPLLARSASLTEDDLVELVRTGDIERRQAIARRPNLTRAVAAALVECGDDQVALSLLRNPGVTLDRPLLERLTERARDARALRAPLLALPALGADLAGRLCDWGTAQERREIVRAFAVDQALVESAITDELQDIAVDLARMGALGETSARLLRAVRQPANKDGDLLVQLACVSEWFMLEAILARFCGVPVPEARRILAARDGEPLAAAAKLLGVERARFSLLYERSRAATDDPRPPEPEEAAGALEAFDRIDAALARHALDAWRIGRRPAAPESGTDPDPGDGAERVVPLKRSRARGRKGKE